MQQQKFRGGKKKRRKKEGKKERNAKVGRVNKIEGNEYSNGWGIFVAGTYEIRRALPNDLENLNGTQFLIRFLDSQPRILFSQNEELKWKTRGIERKFGICIWSMSFFFFEHTRRERVKEFCQKFQVIEEIKNTGSEKRRDFRHDGDETNFSTRFTCYESVETVISRKKKRNTRFICRGINIQDYWKEKKKKKWEDAYLYRKLYGRIPRKITKLLNFLTTQKNTYFTFVPVFAAVHAPFPLP